MRGGHMQAPIPTSHHTHTHMLGTHASFHLIPMFSWPSSGETLICAHSDHLPPRLSSDRGSPAYLSLVLCFLGHRVMRNHVGSQIGALSYPVSPQRGDSPLYGSETFASRLERMHARGDTCKHLYQPLTTLTHIC